MGRPPPTPLIPLMMNLKFWLLTGDSAARSADPRPTEVLSTPLEHHLEIQTNLSSTIQFVYPQTFTF
jgi:hypothetical protein